MTNVHHLSFSLSLPSTAHAFPPTPPDSTKGTLCTNTIAVTSLPKSFFHPVLLELLQSHFATYGEINQWLPLPGFCRIMVVYRQEDDAEAAKLGSDPIVLRGGINRSETTLRVYRADPNPLITFTHSSSMYAIPSSAFLRPPSPEKNFLISPPGSPPVGWEQVREDPPNSAPLADDLMLALKELQLRDLQRAKGRGERSDSLEVLLDPEDGCGVGVYVEDCSLEVAVEEDEMEISEHEWVYGETAPARARWRPIPTALPPVSVTA